MSHVHSLPRHASLVSAIISSEPPSFTICCSHSSYTSDPPGKNKRGLVSHPELRGGRSITVSGQSRRYRAGDRQRGEQSPPPPPPNEKKPIKPAEGGRTQQSSVFVLGCPSFRKGREQRKIKKRHSPDAPNGVSKELWCGKRTLSLRGARCQQPDCRRHELPMLLSRQLFA